MRRLRRSRGSVASIAVLAISVLLYLLNERSNAPRSQGNPSTGAPRIHDGDTLRVGAMHVRFFGMDAPELAQRCTLPNDPNWECGKAARDALIAKVGQAEVTCDARDQDRYGRTVGVCFARGEDLNAWMVREGWAVAYREYSMDYVDEEESAREARRGLWRGTFTAPKDWRRDHDHRRKR